MNPTASTGLLSLISAAVAPVVLITAAAILLSGFSSKYGSIADQMRRLTAERRGVGISPQRLDSIQRQLVLFGRRISAIWAASTCLCLSLLSFLLMILAVIFSQRAMHLDAIGVGTLVVGLAFMVVAVICELEELRLAHLTSVYQLSDPG